MLNENQSTLFIRLLAEAYELDRWISKTMPSMRHTTRLNGSEQRHLSDPRKRLRAFDPQDCALPVPAEVCDRRIG